MSTENIYNILDIPPTTPYEDLDSIKKAYRKKAKEHHPDKNTDNTDEMFKKVTEAYEIASDINKRKEYDFQTGFNPNTPKASMPNMGDIFGFSFNPFFTRSTRQTFFTINEPLHINYLQLFKGGVIHKKIKIQEKIIERDIVLNPKEIRKYDEVIKLDNTDVLIRFVPDLIDDKSLISTEAHEIKIDNHLNMLIIFKINFEKALTGGSFPTTILGEKYNFTIPKCCEIGHAYEVKDLNFLPQSTSNVSFIYDLPKLSKNKIDAIVKIIREK